MQNEKNNYPELVSKLLDFIFLENLNDTDRVKDLLDEYGYDYDDLSNRGVDFVRNLERKQRTLLARKKREKMIEALASVAKSMAHESKETLFKKLKELAAGDPQLQFAFHKLESLSEDDLRNILNDVEALRKFSERGGQSDAPNGKTDT